MKICHCKIIVTCVASKYFVAIKTRSFNFSFFFQGPFFVLHLFFSFLAFHSGLTNSCSEFIHLIFCYSFRTYSEIIHVFFILLVSFSAHFHSELIYLFVHSFISLSDSILIHNFVFHSFDSLNLFSFRIHAFLSQFLGFHIQCVFIIVQNLFTFSFILLFLIQEFRHVIYSPP